MRKRSSTNFINEQKILETCSMALTISLLSGRWKPTIIWQLQTKAISYSDLKKQVTGATERILVKQLQELERDGLVKKSVNAGRSSYALSPLGISLLPVLKQAESWGDSYKAIAHKKTECP